MGFNSLFLIFLGLSILVIVVIDIFLTVIHLGGGGILSKPYSEGIWRIFKLFSGRNPESVILNYAGSFILVSLFFFWISIIWLGFSLIFLADEGSVVDSITDANSNEVGKIYFVGYTLTSLGNGDLKSGSDWWRIMTNIMGMGSIFFVSLVISYLLPVLQTVVAQRTLATYIYQLGNTPEDIILNGWNGKDFSALHKRFSTLETMILKLSEQHMAYPILHYFHADKREYAAPLNLAKLDEALTIREIYQMDKNTDNFNWVPIRRSLDNYLLKMKGNFITPSSLPPPFEYPRIHEFWDDIPIPDSALQKKLNELKERRCLLLGLVEKDLWHWQDINKVEDLPPN